MKEKALVIVYEGMSLSEITLLTDYLTVFQPWGNWWDIDTAGSKKKKMIKSEDSFQIVSNKAFDEINFDDYKVIILSGIMNPYPIVKDNDLIEFLTPLKTMKKRPLIAAISSSPILLAKSGILEGGKFTSGLFEETIDEFDFIERENIIRKPVVYDKEKNIITAIGFAYREFAVQVAQILGFDIPNDSFSGIGDRSYTDEELTFFMHPNND